MLFSPDLTDFEIRGRREGFVVDWDFTPNFTIAIGAGILHSPHVLLATPDSMMNSHLVLLADVTLTNF
jgi:hypothetical protein